MQRISIIFLFLISFFQLHAQDYEAQQRKLEQRKTEII